MAVAIYEANGAKLPGKDSETPLIKIKFDNVGHNRKTIFPADVFFVAKISKMASWFLIPEWN